MNSFSKNASNFKKGSLFLFLVIFQFSNAQTKNDSIDIINVLKKDYLAFGNNDVEKHREYLTDDYILIENGEIWDLNQEIDYLEKNKNRKNKRVDSFEISNLKIFNEIAYVVYDLFSTISKENSTKKYHWTESTIFRKISGKWKIGLIHSTKISEEEVEE